METRGDGRVRPNERTNERTERKKKEEEKEEEKRKKKKRIGLGKLAGSISVDEFLDEFE